VLFSTIQLLPGIWELLAPRKVFSPQREVVERHVVSVMEIKSKAMSIIQDRE
jgi:hypothetical protein